MLTSLSFTPRSYSGEQDLQAIADLLNLCKRFDQEDLYYSVNTLKQDYSSPEFDPNRDLQLWEDTNGRLVAVGSLWMPAVQTQVEGFLGIDVHPQVRDGCLEDEILNWGTQRLQQVSQTHHLPAGLYSGCREHRTKRIAWLQRCGFTSTRCFLRMSPSLTHLPPMQLPQGFTIRDGCEGIDDPAWVDLYNQTFVDHWNFHPATLELVQHWTKDPDYMPALDLVAIDSDGTYAGFCYCHIDSGENHHLGRKEGWISSLGTRRGYRRLGLGRALLIAGLDRLQAAGMETALLGVDPQNQRGCENSRGCQW